MPRGEPLSPEQIEELATLYGELGNATEVASALGVSPSTVTRQLDRLGEQRRATLQRGALERGLRVAGEHMVAVADEVGTLVLTELRAGTAEPKDVNLLAGALARTATALARLDEREEKRRQAKLDRHRARATIALLERKDDKLPPLEKLRGKLTPALLAALLGMFTDEELLAVEASLVRTPAPEPVAADPRVPDPVPEGDGAEETIPKGG